MYPFIIIFPLPSEQNDSGTSRCPCIERPISLYLAQRVLGMRWTLKNCDWKTERRRKWCLGKSLAGRLTKIVKVPRSPLAVVANHEQYLQNRWSFTVNTRRADLKSYNWPRGDKKKQQQNTADGGRLFSFHSGIQKKRDWRKRYSLWTFVSQPVAKTSHLHNAWQIKQKLRGQREETGRWFWTILCSWS